MIYGSTLGSEYELTVEQVNITTRLYQFEYIFLTIRL